MSQHRFTSSLPQEAMDDYSYRWAPAMHFRVPHAIIRFLVLAWPSTASDDLGNEPENWGLLFLSLFHSLLSSSPIPPCHSVSLSNKSMYKEKEQSKTELCQMQIHIRCPVKLVLVSHFCFSSIVINCVVIMVVASIGNVSLHSCGLVRIYMILLTITKALR